MPIIKIALVDDHILFREGMRHLIEKFSDFSIVFEASDGIEMIEKLESADSIPDLILMDIKMPRMDGIASTRFLKIKYPQIVVVAFSIFFHKDVLSEIVSSGAVGYISKDTDGEKLVSSIQDAFNGMNVCESGCHKEPYSLKTLQSPELPLTPRQKEFLRLCCTDLAYKQIADQMKISCNTANRFRENLFGKLNVKTRVSLVIYAMEIGLAPY